jgi:nucleoside-diphosphate-sugar epimerase
VVTGSSGFVGQRLVEMLIERGATTVVAFDVAPKPGTHTWLAYARLAPHPSFTAAVVSSKPVAWDEYALSLSLSLLKSPRRSFSRVITLYLG